MVRWVILCGRDAEGFTCRILVPSQMYPVSCQNIHEIDSQSMSIDLEILYIRKHVFKMEAARLMALQLTWIPAHAPRSNPTKLDW